MYGCGACGAHIAMEEDVVSKDFCGSTGRAYFVNQVFNGNLSLWNVASVTCMKKLLLIYLIQSPTEKDFRSRKSH